MPQVREETLMYTHLLVPIDASSLANRLVDQALEYAKRTGARVCFMHAQADFAATGEGALLHSAAPDAFSNIAAGNAYALLAKAEAAAKAAGVVCSTCSVVSDRPHQAILDAAQSSQCDLIFMASHGRRGLASVWRGSTTQKVLQHATLPVLVASVEANITQTDELRALGIIKDEHRSLAAVVRGLQSLVTNAVAAGATPDFALIRAMLFYIQAFPERQHHPKEDEFLFARLRLRSSECNAVMAELAQQHQGGASVLAHLLNAVMACENGQDAGGKELLNQVNRFAQSQWYHMHLEESMVLPAASRYLQPEDWAQIAQAFAGNTDPRFAQESEDSFAGLFARLMNLQAGIAS
jgi:nucleotide-binding universal stress UspA family protein/hemerythrin-like domain-containing protein